MDHQIIYYDTRARGWIPSGPVLIHLISSPNHFHYRLLYTYHISMHAKYPTVDVLYFTLTLTCFMKIQNFFCCFLKCFVTFSALWSRHSLQQSLAKQLPVALTATTQRVPWSNISVCSIRKTSSDQLWSLLRLISGICLKEEKKNSTNIHFASSLTYSKRLELRMLIDCTNIPAHWISLSALYSLFTNPKVGLGPVLARLIFSAHLKSAESSDDPFTILSACFVTSVTLLCRR